MRTAPVSRNKIFGFAPTVFFLGLVSLANDLASEMIYPLLPVFLTGIGASMTFIGLLEGIAEATASILKLFSGWLADRRGNKRILTAGGYALSNAVRPLIGLATAGWQVLLLRFTDRAGKGVRSSPRDAIIGDSTPLAERGRAYGFNRAMDHGGAMLGGLAAFLLMTYGGLPIARVFLWSAVPGALAVLCVLLGIGVARDPAIAPVAAPKLSLRPFGRRFRLFLGVLAVFSLGNSSDAFLLLRAKELGIATAALPLIWIVFHAVKSLASMPSGILSDRIGRTRLIVAGWAVYAAVYLGFTVASRPAHAWLLFATYGLFHGLTEGVEKAFVADLTPPESRGTAFGVYHFLLGIVALPSSLLCGFLWNSFSSRVALGTGAALATVAGIALAAIDWSSAPKESARDSGSAR